jgi:hypothetical protein
MVKNSRSRDCSKGFMFYRWSGCGSHKKPEAEDALPV